MKIIFEFETVVGKCDYERGQKNHLQYAEPNYATLLAHTQASLTNGLFKIEQRCYLRNGGSHSPEQPWIRPQVKLIPSLESHDEMLAIAQAMHQKFLIYSWRNIPDECLV